MSCFTHEYPNTNFHEMNLDWFLCEFGKLNKKVDTIMSDKVIEAIDKYFNSLMMEAIYDEPTETITLKKKLIAGDGVHVYDKEHQSMIIE